MANFVDCWNQLKSKGYKHADGSEVLNEQDRASIEKRIQEHLKTGLDPLEAAKASVKSHLDEAHAQLQSVYDQFKPPAETPATTVGAIPQGQALASGARVSDGIAAIEKAVEPWSAHSDKTDALHTNLRVALRRYGDKPLDDATIEKINGAISDLPRYMTGDVSGKPQPVSEAGQTPAVAGQPKTEGGIGEEKVQVQGQEKGRVLEGAAAEPPAAAVPTTASHPAVAEFQEHAPSSVQSLGIVPRTSEFVRQDVARIVTGISKGFRQIKAALTPANVSPVAGHTARIVREHAGQLARDNEIAMTALRDAAQVMRRNSKVENLAIIDRLEKGQPLGNKGLDDYRSARQSAYDQRIKQVQDINPNALQDLIENYFPHLWTRESVERLHGNIENIPADNPWGRIFGKRPLTGPASFLKQRSIPTTAEGIALGLEPVTTNPVALDLLKMHEMDRYVMGHKIMQEIKDNGLAKFVPAGGRPDFGHIKINDRIARVYGPRGWKIVDEEGRQMPGQKVLGDYYAPEDAARIINNYLSPGLRGNAVYDSFRFVGNAMNQVQLGISAYHAFFTAIDSATSTIALGLEQIARSGGSAAEIAKGAGQVAKGFVETPVGSMIENLWRGNKFLREYSKPGTTNAELARIVDSATAGGARVRMDTFYNTGAVEKFFDALKSGNYTGAVLRAPLALVQTISKPLMEYTVPRLKLGIISQQLEYELSKLPKNATQDQVRIVAGRVVDSVDNRMGQLIYDNLFWNKALKDGLMASVRSVGWNLGDIRELGGGTLDAITAPKRAYTALTKGTEIADNPVFTKRMAYTFALPFYVGVLGSVYQYLMTGKGPQSIQDAFMPRTGRRKADGTEERVMLPTYMKDVYPLALATGREGVTGLVSRGYRMAVNKLHPALSSIGQMIHNQDYYGNQILSPDDPLIQQHPTMGKIFREAEFIAKQFQPFSFRGVGQREGGVKEKLQAVAGIMPATRELTDTPAMRMIHDINIAKRPSGGYTMMQQQKREDRKKAQSGLDLRPMLFKRLSNEEKARVLEVATPEERAVFQSGSTSRTRRTPVKTLRQGQVVP